MPSKTILIVDDELSILVPLQFLMEKEGVCGQTGPKRQGGHRKNS